MRRHLSNEEANIFEILLAVDFVGKQAIQQQLHAVAVDDLDDNGSLRLYPASGPRAEVRHRIPIEAETSDVDGTRVHVLLHVVDGMVDELEVYREDSRPLQSRLTAEGLTVVPPSRE